MRPVRSRPPAVDGNDRLDLWTPPEILSHPLLRETLTVLQSLARRAGSTTPYILLCAAVEEMQVRPIVRGRRTRTAERALANVDLYLEQARPYDVRGLREFSMQMRRQWEKASRSVEARPAVSLITMHSSKGLEWPVVIPINTATAIQNRVAAAVDLTTGALHTKIFGIISQAARIALAAEEAEFARERLRLWYVATTRARDLLVSPRLSCTTKPSWWVSLAGRLGSRATIIRVPLNSPVV